MYDERGRVNEGPMEEWKKSLDDLFMITNKESLPIKWDSSTV
jgi:hypothetical protein